MRGLLVLLLTFGCGTPRGSGGGVPVDPRAELPDGETTGGTTGVPDSGFTSDGAGGTSELALFLGDAGLFFGDVYDLPKILPSETAEVRVRVQVANLGAHPLEITNAGLLTLNADGSAPNKFITLEWDDFDHETGFPLVLAPHGQDATAILQGDIVYAPLGPDSNGTTFAVATSDALIGQRVVKLQPPAFVPEVRIHPSEGVFWFADLANAEDLTIEVHNDGLGLLEVTGVSFDGKAANFELVPPEVTGVVKPSISEGYKPLEFAVRYQPKFGANLETASLIVATDDPNNPTVSVPLESKYETSPDQSPCVWQLPPADTLDFSDTLTGQKAITLVMTNVGQQTCTVSAVSATNDPNNVHYVFTGLIPGNAAVDPPEPDVPVDAYPVGVPPGKELQLTVTYLAGDAGFDSPIVIEYTDPLPREIELSAVGGPNKPCLDLGPKVDGEVMELPFVGTPQGGAQRQLVVHSCGDGTLTIESITIKDTVTPEADSVYWAVGSPGASDIKVAPHSYQPVTILMTLPNEDGLSITGTATLKWTDGTGVQLSTVPLTASVDITAILPLADPGSSDAYPDALVGTPLILDGSASTPGAADAAIDGGDGYLWYIISKPAGSEAGVGDAWGASTKIVIPDVAGVYTFGLIVRNDLGLLSNNAALNINVAGE